MSHRTGKLIASLLTLAFAFGCKMRHASSTLLDSAKTTANRLHIEHALLVPGPDGKFTQVGARLGNIIDIFGDHMDEIREVRIVERTLLDPEGWAPERSRALLAPELFGNGAYVQSLQAAGFEVEPLRIERALCPGCFGFTTENRKTHYDLIERAGGTYEVSGQVYGELQLGGHYEVDDRNGHTVTVEYLSREPGYPFSGEPRAAEARARTTRLEVALDASYMATAKEALARVPLEPNVQSLPPKAPATVADTLDRPERVGATSAALEAARIEKLSLEQVVAEVQERSKPILALMEQQPESVRLRLLSQAEPLPLEEIKTRLERLDQLASQVDALKDTRGSFRQPLEALRQMYVENLPMLERVSETMVNKARPISAGVR
jgi:hypothetical protein